MSVIAVDVDLTVVDSLTPWMDWLEEFTDEKVKNVSGAYNLEPEIREILLRAGRDDVDPLEYWKNPCLYDTMEPIEGAVEALANIKRRGHQVVFVSSCFPEHTASKERLLKRCFPFADGFIATHDKHFVGYDALIDDKLEHMRLGLHHRPRSQHILFTGVRADGTQVQRMMVDKISSWDKLERLLFCTRQLRYNEPAFA
jgi:5'(3')-deoxyribonucleotidase